MIRTNPVTTPATPVANRSGPPATITVQPASPVPADVLTLDSKPVSAQNEASLVEAIQEPSLCLAPKQATSVSPVTLTPIETPPPAPTPWSTSIQEYLRSGERNGYFLDGTETQGLDINQIKNAKLFTMCLDGPHAEDALVASGVALATSVPSLYIVPDRKSLPWFQGQADQTYPQHVAIREGKEPLRLADTIQQLGKTSGPLASPVDLTDGPKDVTTFLGCLMSGLSEQQYAEGRGHLQAIAAGLNAAGSDKTYCEGIQVSSSNSFGTPRESLAVDLDVIRQSQHCVFYLYDDKSRPSGMWVELGYALGLGKPCTLLSPGSQALPPSLEGVPGLKIINYAGHEQLLSRVSEYSSLGLR